MLAVAKCCLMAIPRSDSSPASPLPGFFLRDKPHYSSDCTSHSLFFGWPCGETSRSGGYRRSGSRATILYDLRRIHSTSPVPVPRNKISQTSSKGAPRRYVIRATIHAPPTSQIMIARGTGTGSTTASVLGGDDGGGNCSYPAPARPVGVITPCGGSRGTPSPSTLELRLRLQSDRSIAALFGGRGEHRPH
jgi:hypothetical protein